MQTVKRPPDSEKPPSHPASPGQKTCTIGTSGPDGDGGIPEPAVRIMEQIGDWMKINSEAIYGTTASPFQALDWGYCTQKNGKLYLHVFDRPADGKINLPIKNKVTAVYALASPKMKLKSTLENGRPAIPVDVFDSNGAAITKENDENSQTNCGFGCCNGED